MESSARSLFKHVKQICVVVRSVEEAARRYSDRFGFGPWYFYTYRNATGLVHGTEQTFSVRIALTMVDDSFQWELLEPLDDNSIYAEFLRVHGEGVQHIGFDVQDVPATIADVGAVLRSDNGGLAGGVQRYAMLDTVEELGVLAEVMDYTDDWVRPGYDGTYPPGDVETGDPGLRY